MERPTIQVSEVPHSGEGLIPGPGLPPARFAGWQPTPDSQNVPYPQVHHNECLPGIANPCNPGPGRCVVPAMQPIVPVPVHQQIIKRDRIIEVPKTVIVDSVVPNVAIQPVEHDIPDVRIVWNEKSLEFEKIQIVEKPVTVDVPIGYNFKVVPKWEIREVPKIIPKYVGEQETIEIPVPQVRVVDKNIEKEIPIYVGEKVVEKEVIEEEEDEIVEYKYVVEHQEVPVYKYKPVFDVEVEVPPPLLVPVPLQPEEVEGEAEVISLHHWKQMNQPSGGVSCCGPAK